MSSGMACRGVIIINLLRGCTADLPLTPHAAPAPNAAAARRDCRDGSALPTSFQRERWQPSGLGFIKDNLLDLKGFRDHR